MLPISRLPLVLAALLVVETGTRVGHDDMREALIYQRATSEADRLIARRLSGLVDEHRGIQRDDPEDGDDGPAGVLVPVG